MKRLLAALLLLAALPAAAAAAAAAAPSTPADTKPSTQAFAAPPARTEDYLVGANDLLEIKVFEMPQLDRKLRISADGTISLPLLGLVRVAGLTARQAEEQIAQLLRDGNFVKDPQVSVFVAEFVSRRVYVQGAVDKPGIIDLLGDRTLLDVIGEAGGLNDRADTRIFIIRPFGKPGEDRIEVDAERLVYAGDPLANVQVQPGDIILVPYQQDFQVYVNGAVKNPGEVKYKSDDLMTVLQAVTKAGGATDRANESRVQVIRRNPDGGKQLFKVNLKKIKRGKDEDMMLQRNDIVVVPESFF